MEEIIVALITGGLSFLGVVFTNNKSNAKIQADLKVSQAVTECKIEELTREVRKHNDFAERIPTLEEKMKVVNNRVKNLEEVQLHHE